jgi:crossover junction endodeoxyribonuclease RusA
VDMGNARYVLDVSGRPISQGSMSVFRGRIVHQKSRELMAWRGVIYEMCRDMMDPLDGPVKVSITFRMPEPKGNNRRWPHVRPDVDKLARAVLDGLTGAAFADDCQVVDLRARKVYGTPGAEITIEGLHDETLPM